MATFALDVPSDGYYLHTFRSTLDGQNYEYALRYNARTNQWMRDVGVAGSPPSVRGVPLVYGVDNLRAFKALDVPPGSEDLLPNDDSLLDPGLEDLGVRAQWTYTEVDE